MPLFCVHLILGGIWGCKFARLLTCCPPTSTIAGGRQGRLCHSPSPQQHPPPHYLLTTSYFCHFIVQAGAKGDSAMQPLAARPDAAAGPQQWAALAGAQADALAALAGERLLAMSRSCKP